MAIDRRLIGEPDDFSALLDLYNRNYIRLNRLIDLANADQDRYISWTDTGLAVYLHITERHVFTTELRMTYFIKDETGFVSADPDARLRVYHDSKQVEATHCYPGSISEPIFGSLVPVDDVVEHRWKMNRFLDKWLDYLEKHGHNRATFRVASENEWPNKSIVIQPDWIDNTLLKGHKRRQPAEG